MIENFNQTESVGQQHYIIVNLHDAIIKYIHNHGISTYGWGQVAINFSQITPLYTIWPRYT